MDLSELRTATRRRANVPSTDGVWADAFVNEAVNTALVQIGLMQPWYWLENTHTEAGDSTGTVDLSAVTPLVRDIKSVHVGSYESEPTSTRDIDSWLTGDRPGFIHATFGDDLLIRPEPNSGDTITVRYYRDEAILSDDADEPIMPAAYHYAIAEKAAAIGFESLDDESSAMMHERRATAILNNITNTALRRVRGPHSVRVRSGSQF